MDMPRSSPPPVDPRSASRAARLSVLLGLALATGAPLVQGAPGAASAASGGPGVISRPKAPTSAAAASATPLPAVNLWIEWRQIDEVVREESARGGSTVVTSTARSAAPDAGRQWSTAPSPAGDTGPNLGQLRLRNGGRGHLDWSRTQFFEWVSEVWMPPAAPRPGGSPAGATGASIQRQGLPAGRQLELAARWPGGQAPVEIDFSVLTQAVDRPGDALPQPLETRVAGSVLVPLDHWTTLARSGGAADADGAARGTTSTLTLRPAASLLQVRVRSAALPALPR